jgi:catechol 2,3-dioxygenase-like lactoylglutathione lyase family enzyme
MRGEWVPPQVERPRSRSAETATPEGGLVLLPASPRLRSVNVLAVVGARRPVEARSRPVRAFPTEEVNMSSTDTSTEVPDVGTIDMKLEVVTLPVSDVDRAKSFYQSLGWRLDVDLAAGDDFRAVQFTPPHSQCSIHFGKGVTTAEPGSVQALELVVDDIDSARDDLISRGVDVSEVFEQRPPGFESVEGRSYFMYASFSDPDGNGWLLQEVTTRLPGREWED